MLQSGATARLTKSYLWLNVCKQFSEVKSRFMFEGRTLMGWASALGRL